MTSSEYKTRVLKDFVVINSKPHHLDPLWVSGQSVSVWHRGGKEVELPMSVTDTRHAESDTPLRDRVE